MTSEKSYLIYKLKSLGVKINLLSFRKHPGFLVPTEHCEPVRFILSRLQISRREWFGSKRKEGGR